jgi:hypothetical protein
MQKYICRTVFFIITGAILCPNTFTPKAQGLAESTGPGGSNAQAVHTLGETGQDINIGLISANNILTTHEAFQDANGRTRAFNHDFTGDGISIIDHDTWMAGIAASNGSPSHPNDIGIAPGADIHSARVLDNNGILSSAYLTSALDGPNGLITKHNCRVIMTGFAFDDIDPNGQSYLTKMYDYYAYKYNVVFANAAGNGDSQIWVFGDAYNGITTGGLIVTDPNVYNRVGSASGSGLTSDGRRKPDVVGPSQNQIIPTTPSNDSWTDPNWIFWGSTSGETSFSTPHTAGVAALLWGLADDTNDPNDEHNEVIRAVIVNSTFPNIKDKFGNSTNPADPNNTWQRDRGYGRLDALRAYELLDSNQVHTDVNITQEKGWAYTTMTSSYENDSYLIYGEKNERLVLTVTWNRLVSMDVHGNYNEESAPKFNLNLTIKDPNGQIIFSEPNMPDNLEKVDLLLPGNGIYEVVVKNTTTKTNRSYALAFELLSPIPGDFNIDYIVDYNDMAILAQQWLLKGENLEADLNNDNTVNLFDFAEFASYWLQTDDRYYQN